MSDDDDKIDRESDDYKQFSAAWDRDVVKLEEERAKRRPMRRGGPAAAKAPMPSEDELALEFCARYGLDWRHVSDWNRWFSWSGSRWEAEKTRLVFEKARDICRDMNASRRLRTASAIETLSRSDRRCAAHIEQWDSNLFLTNANSGTIDCRTGKLFDHERENYCTKLLGASPGILGCPKFFKFLNEIFGDHEELIGYLQKVFGYCLTGSTVEHQLWFCYGTGRNGKGVLLSTIRGILGDYAKTAPIDTFVTHKGREHPTELAGLMGARLVIANETEEGRRWAEAKIKTLTGGDEISARFMRQDYFDFTPQFKLIVSGNHKPSLRTVDIAIRSRFNLIPFDVTIPEERRNPNLAEELKHEWPGILQWMIDGCLAWQAEGLKAPEIVRKATEEYLADEDSMAEWIEECCDVGPNKKGKSAELYKSWKSWSELHGEFTGSQKLFTEKMRTKGFQDDRKNSGKIFIGIDVIFVEQSSSWQQY